MRPVMVGASFRRPSSFKRLPTKAEPPASYKSKAIYCPPGFKSPITGVVREISSNTSISNSTPASRAIASKCRIALVDAAVAVIAVTALRKLASQIMSRGKRLSRTASIRISPHLNAVSFLASTVAGTSLTPIGDSPKNVIAMAIELAVN